MHHSSFPGNKVNEVTVQLVAPSGDGPMAEVSSQGEAAAALVFVLLECPFRL